MGCVLMRAVEDFLLVVVGDDGCAPVSALDEVLALVRTLDSTICVAFCTLHEGCALVKVRDEGFALVLALDEDFATV